MKKLLTGLMAVVMMAGLAGCGSKDDGAGEGSDTAKKELTVYTNYGYKPYEMVDEKGNLYGFDIDVMNEAAKLAGYTVKWEDVDFDGIVPSVKVLQASHIPRSVQSRWISLMYTMQERMHRTMC